MPILWDGDCVVWDSLAIIEFLADRVGRDQFWPDDEAARGMARSMAAEMHSGFANLRRELPMNVRKNFGSVPLSPEVEAEVVRILNLWAQARARFGGSGEYLFGDWCAADIMFAPVVTRFVTYGVKVPPFAATYMEAVLHRADVVEWIELAQEEPWVIEEYEETGRPSSLNRACRPCADIGRSARRRAGRCRDNGSPCRCRPPTTRKRHGASLSLTRWWPLATSFGKAAMSPGPQHGSAVVLDQHRLALEHHQQFVLALVPVALARPGAGLEPDHGWRRSRSGRSAGASRRYQRPATSSVERRRIAGAVGFLDGGKIDFRHGDSPC